MKVVCLNWCTDEQFIELAGAGADGSLGVAPFAPATGKAEGLAQPAEYLSSTGGSLEDKGVHYVQGWYTMSIMAQGIRAAAEKGKVTGETLKQALEELKAVDTGGVSAPIDFSGDSHAGMPGSKIYEIQGGKWVDASELLTGS